MRSPVSLLVDGLRPPVHPVPSFPWKLYPVGRLVEAGRSWRVFVVDGDLVTFDEDGTGGALALVLAPEAVAWDDAWARGFARSSGVALPIGGAR